MTARTDENTAGEVARRQLLDGATVEEHAIESAGMSTSYLAAGDGPPLVLLHGPGEFKERWVRVVDELSRTHRVLAPDFPPSPIRSSTRQMSNRSHHPCR